MSNGFEIVVVVAVPEESAGSVSDCDIANWGKRPGTAITNNWNIARLILLPRSSESGKLRRAAAWSPWQRHPDSESRSVIEVFNSSPPANIASYKHADRRQ
jgi:hypothetical protein